MKEIKGRGGISAKIIADSINENGKRITTMQLRYPRFIHGEFMTHRVFSRNAASSRAIPVAKMIEQVRNDPAMPIHWGKNQPGMQANAQLEGEALANMKLKWTTAAANAAAVAAIMEREGGHKQVVNRILEPFQFMQTVVTATQWYNFFALRDHKDAQPEIKELAICMDGAMNERDPELLTEGEWHLPYVTADEKVHHTTEELIMFSAARCARVSYLNHDKSKPSQDKDFELYNMLAVRPYDDGKGHVLGDNDPVHLSPLEHQATPMKEISFEDMAWRSDVTKAVTHIDANGEGWSGNFQDWIQYRQVA